MSIFQIMGLSLAQLHKTNSNCLVNAFSILAIFQIMGPAIATEHLDGWEDKQPVTWSVTQASTVIGIIASKTTIGRCHFLMSIKIL